jgi:aromatic-L-amino-acid decarboxylase
VIGPGVGSGVASVVGSGVASVVGSGVASVVGSGVASVVGSGVASVVGSGGPAGCSGAITFGFSSVTGFLAIARGGALGRPRHDTPDAARSRAGIWRGPRGRLPRATLPAMPGPLLPDPHDPLAAARWHPEPELIAYGDEASARAALERLGEETWRTALDYLFREGVRRGAAPVTYPELRARYFAPSGGRPSFAPADPSTSGAILGEFTERLAPYLLNPYHPGTLSYFTPSVLPMSIAGEVIAQWANQGIDVWACGPAGAFVEEEVVRWLCDLVGYGRGAETGITTGPGSRPESFGVLASGGTIANLMGMMIVRDVHLPRRAEAAAAALAPAAALDPDGMEAAGLRPYPPPPRGASLEGWRVYASDQAHYSIAKALDVLGFPEGTLAVVPSDARFRLQGGPVEAQVRTDVKAGLQPLAIAAVVGSTNTGSVDATGELAEVAARHGLWLHVDAAYGGAALLSARDAARVPDLAQADSITIDPHKWFFQAYDIGGLLVRRRADLEQTFHRAPEYYRTAHHEEQPLNWYELALEGTRRWRALKLWMSWKHLGTSGFGRLVEANDDLARHLADRVAAADDFESIPAGRPDLSVVCFRHLPGGPARAAAIEAADPGALDRYTDRLATLLQHSGEGWLSTTVLRGRTYLRAGIVNFLSSPEAVDRILDLLRGLSADAAREAAVPGLD